MSLIFFILAAHGLTQLLCHGKIFDKLDQEDIFGHVLCAWDFG